MIGGFLGAGKTTTIARLAQEFISTGNKVGIVTNDQAANLVDTLSLRSQGFDVGEVAGACFCCNFNDLTDTIQDLEDSQHPDIVICEPVGSCTDLAATVIQPMIQLHEGRFDIAPYGVILKPSHGRKILSGDQRGGFSPKAAYIFKKQLEEADFAIVNQIDRLSDEQVAELTQLLQDNYGDLPIGKMSAKTGQGFSELLEMLKRKGDFGRKILDLDYDVYAEGEAELGWLNTALKLESNAAVSLDKITLEIVQEIHRRIDSSQSEVAHLKVLSIWDGAHAVANLTSSEGEPVLSLSSDIETTQADIVVNARVATDPEQLSSQVDAAIVQVAETYSVELKTIKSQSFRPGRPVPTHRFETPAD